MEASLEYSPDPNARLILQTIAQLNASGYVAFERLGISNVVSNFSVVYNLKPIVGVNE